MSFRGVVWCGMIWSVQGLDKKQTVAKHGMDQVMIWRRSYTTPPPFLDDDRYVLIPSHTSQYVAGFSVDLSYRVFHPL